MAISFGAVRALLLASALLLGCTERGAAPVAPDAGGQVPAVADAGPAVGERSLDAWLRWQAQLAALGPSSAVDGGLRARARQEAALLSAAGLSEADADAIEAVVAAVVAERNVARLTGAQALEQFKASLAQLAPEQRTKAEAALAELQAKSPTGSLAPVEARFGAEAVRVVLTREPEVTKTWDALLEARGDKR